MVSKSKLIFDTNIQNFIKKNYPVLRKRTALWFFRNETKQNLSNESSSNDEDGQKTSVKISSNKIFSLWRTMDPESKRRYYNMAELDEIRRQKQRSTWISEVGALLMKHGDIKPEELSKYSPSFEQLQEEFRASLEKIHKNYEQMIQADSTKMLYKNAMRNMDLASNQLTPDELKSMLPEEQQYILNKPKRPPNPYQLYLQDNLERLKMKRKQLGLKGPYLRIGAEEWTSLSKDVKFTYEVRYSELKEAYNKAMDEFKTECKKAHNWTIIEKTLREKRQFKKSLRKKLRDASVLPTSIRNPFNFFLMEHNDIPLAKLSEMWRNLPEDAKSKYVKMHEDDIKRYKSERTAYDQITLGLARIAPYKLISQAEGEPLNDTSSSSEVLENAETKGSGPP